MDIDERSESVENRARAGRLEGDLVNGPKGTGNLVTIAGRMTRFVFFACAATKEADAVASTAIGLLASLPKGFLKTLAFDNGKESALFKAMEQAPGVKVCFAKPYHSWERGTDGNRNGVVRKILPKGRSFDDIAGEEMRRIDCMLNGRPLKRLDRCATGEAFPALLVRCAAEIAA